jgi:hypothetical protein
MKSKKHANKFIVFLLFLLIVVDDCLRDRSRSEIDTSSVGCS